MGTQQKYVMTQVCPICKDSFSRIGNHWNQSSDCHYPEIPEISKRVLRGCLMGDGTVVEGTKHSNMSIYSINKDYLSELQKDLGFIAGKVHLSRSSEKALEDASSNEFFDNPQSFSDYYMLYIRAHPFIDKLREWYSSGKKVYPKNITLYPETLTHWYCGDGHFKNHGTSHYISIGVSNEREEKEKIEEMFAEIDVKISRWEEEERKDGSINTEICFSKENSEHLWDYMAEYKIPRQFEYKWPSEYHNS